MAHDVKRHAQAEVSARLDTLGPSHVAGSVGEIVEAIRDEMRGPGLRTDLVEPDAE